MKCIVRGCPSDGIRPITIALPKGAFLGRHEVLAQEFRAEVKVCLRHHRQLVAAEKTNLSSYSMREEV